MTPARVARKRFAGDFDLDGHLAERGANLSRRLAQAERLVGGWALSARGQGQASDVDGRLRIFMVAEPRSVRVGARMMLVIRGVTGR
jgi:hypothetical protein